MSIHQQRIRAVRCRAPHGKRGRSWRRARTVWFKGAGGAERAASDSGGAVVKAAGPLLSAGNLETLSSRPGAIPSLESPSPFPSPSLFLCSLCSGTIPPFRIPPSVTIHRKQLRLIPMLPRLCEQCPLSKQRETLGNRRTSKSVVSTITLPKSNTT